MSVVAGERDLAERLTAVAGYRFDLAVQIPIRAALLRVSGSEHVLVVVVHHIAADGASLVPLARDVARAYAARVAGREPGWDRLPVQYADYTLWQREVLGSEDDPGSVLSAQFAYWRAELAGLPEQVVLPTDRPRPAVQSFRGETVGFTIEAGLRAAVEGLARSRGATVSMVLQSALVVLLHKLGGGDDIVVGGPVAGRTDEVLADLVGFFVNTWVLRVDVSGDPRFVQVLERVRGKALGAYEHQDAPFERLVELLNPARSTAYHPLFQVALALQNNPFPRVEFPGLVVEPVGASTGTAKFDLFVNLTELPSTAAAPRGIEGFVEYAADLFDRGTVEAIAARYVRVLRAMVADPGGRIGRLDVLEPAERERVLWEWNATAVAVPAVTVPGLFAAAAAASPEAVAVSCGDRRWTYRRLDETSNRWARVLISRGVGPESVVAVALPRSVELVVAVLAIGKAGGGYLPIDPEYPSERTGFVLTDAAPRLVLTDTATAAVLPAVDVPVLELDALDGGAGDPGAAAPITDAERVAPLRPEHLAYVMYTSGSTGVPKGVAICHRNVINMVLHGWPEDRRGGSGC